MTELAIPFPHIWVPRKPQVLESRIGTPGSMSGGMQSLSGAATGLFGANGIAAPPGTPLIWLDARQGLYSDTSLTTPQTSDGGVVKGWKDFSGNSNSPLLPGSASPLVLKTNILHGTINVVRSVQSTPDNALQVAFTWNQPEHLFVVFVINTWNSSKYIMDGNTGDSMDMLMRTSSPNWGMFAGAHGPQNSDLAVGTFGIAYCFFSGSSSLSQINANTAQTGNAGTTAAGGITIGSHHGTGAGGGSGTSSACDFVAILGYADSSGVPTGTTVAAVRSYLNTQFTIF